MNTTLIAATSAPAVAFGAGVVALWTVLEPDLVMDEAQAAGIIGGIASVVFTLRSVVLYFVPKKEDTHEEDPEG